MRLKVRRPRFDHRSIGVAYLVVGAGTGVGAVVGGGAVAVTWTAICGAMGVAWLARTDAEVRPDRIVLPRRGLRRREIAVADVAAVHVPGRWDVDPVGHVELRDGSRVRLPGLGPDQLTTLAAVAQVPLLPGS